jgi:hypothetical protein
VAGRGWGLPKVTPARMRLLGMMNPKLFNSSFLVNSMISGLTCDANNFVCVDSCCELRGLAMTMFRWSKQRRAFTQQPTPGLVSDNSASTTKYSSALCDKLCSEIDSLHVPSDVLVRDQNTIRFLAAAGFRGTQCSPTAALRFHPTTKHLRGTTCDSKLFFGFTRTRPIP